MKRLSKRARNILLRLVRMPDGAKGITVMVDGIVRPEPEWCYLNRNEPNKYPIDMAKWRAVYSANRRTMDALWQAGLIDKYRQPNDARAYYFQITPAGIDRIRPYAGPVEQTFIERLAG